MIQCPCCEKKFNFVHTSSGSGVVDHILWDHLPRQHVDNGFDGQGQVIVVKNCPVCWCGEPFLDHEVEQFLMHCADRYGEPSWAPNRWKYVKRHWFEHAMGVAK